MSSPRNKGGIGAYLQPICASCPNYQPESLEQAPVFMAPTSDRMYLIKIKDDINQLRAEVQGWRQKHAVALKEIDSLKAILSRKRYRY